MNIPVPIGSPAACRAVVGAFCRAALAGVFSLAVAGCGGGFGGGGASGGSPVLGSPPKLEPVAVVSGGEISAENGRKVAESVSRMGLGGETEVSPEDVGVSHDPAILDSNPFSASRFPSARSVGAAVARSAPAPVRGYKAFEYPVPAEDPVMTVAVWISEGPAEEGSEVAAIYVRLRVYIAPAKLGLVDSERVRVLETQDVEFRVKAPKPKTPQVTATVTVAATVAATAIAISPPACGSDEVLHSERNACVSLVPADGLCPAGSLPAGGLTKGELDGALYNELRVGWSDLSRASDAKKVCEFLRRGADLRIIYTGGKPRCLWRWRPTPGWMWCGCCLTTGRM